MDDLNQIFKVDRIGNFPQNENDRFSVSREENQGEDEVLEELCEKNQIQPINDPSVNEEARSNGLESSSEYSESGKDMSLGKSQNDPEHTENKSNRNLTNEEGGVIDTNIDSGNSDNKSFNNQTTNDSICSQSELDEVEKMKICQISSSNHRNQESNLNDNANRSAPDIVDIVNKDISFNLTNVSLSGSCTNEEEDALLMSEPDDSKNSPVRCEDFNLSSKSSNDSQAVGVIDEPRNVEDSISHESEINIGKDSHEMQENDSNNSNQKLVDITRSDDSCEILVENKSEIDENMDVELFNKSELKNSVEQNENASNEVDEEMLMEICEGENKKSEVSDLLPEVESKKHDVEAESLEFETQISDRCQKKVDSVDLIDFDSEVSLHENLKDSEISDGGKEDSVSEGSNVTHEVSEIDESTDSKVNETLTEVENGNKIEMQSNETDAGERLEGGVSKFNEHENIETSVGEKVEVNNSRIDQELKDSEADMDEEFTVTGDASNSTSIVNDTDNDYFKLDTELNVEKTDDITLELRENENVEESSGDRENENVEESSGDSENGVEDLKSKNETEDEESNKVEESAVNATEDEHETPEGDDCDRSEPKTDEHKSESIDRESLDQISSNFGASVTGEGEPLDSNIEDSSRIIEDTGDNVGKGKPQETVGEMGISESLDAGSECEGVKESGNLDEPCEMKESGSEVDELVKDHTTVTAPDGESQVDTDSIETGGVSDNSNQYTSAQYQRDKESNNASEPSDDIEECGEGKHIEREQSAGEKEHSEDDNVALEERRGSENSCELIEDAEDSQEGAGDAGQVPDNEESRRTEVGREAEVGRKDDDCLVMSEDDEMEQTEPKSVESIHNVDMCEPMETDDIVTETDSLKNEGTEVKPNAPISELMEVDEDDDVHEIPNDGAQTDRQEDDDVQEVMDDSEQTDHKVEDDSAQTDRQEEDDVQEVKEDSEQEGRREDDVHKVEDDNAQTDRHEDDDVQEVKDDNEQTDRREGDVHKVEDDSAQTDMHEDDDVQEVMDDSEQEGRREDDVHKVEDDSAQTDRREDDDVQEVHDNGAQTDRREDEDSDDYDLGSDRDGAVSHGEEDDEEENEKGDSKTEEKEKHESGDEETITGDTNTQPQLSSTEENVCIVPDEKNTSASDVTEDKPNDDEEVKSRVKRNAAKLADSKIKSLVKNDLLSVDEEECSQQSVVTDKDKVCSYCQKTKPYKLKLKHKGTLCWFCSDDCHVSYVKQHEQVEPESAISLPEQSGGTFVRKCSYCLKTVDPAAHKNLLWETMDFCDRFCLADYQAKLVSKCANCKSSVSVTSMGKYCVRFGYDIKQFCRSGCLEEYKKGLKVCSYCQKDISSGTDSFLAPVGDKGQFKDFCTQSCMEHYEKMSSSAPQPDEIENCGVCGNKKAVKIELHSNNGVQKLCSEPCFSAFKFVNNITADRCDMCKKYFSTLRFSIFYDDSPHSFCSKTCMNVYILANRKIVPCGWCKVKKYNFDMIRKTGEDGVVTMVCSLNCLGFCVSGSTSSTPAASTTAKPHQVITCDNCSAVAKVQFHLTMPDGNLKSFCGQSCVLAFQKATFGESASTPIGVPVRSIVRRTTTTIDNKTANVQLPVIQSVQSLVQNGPPRLTIPVSDINLVPGTTTPITIKTTQSAAQPVQPPPKPQVFQQILVKPHPYKEMKNKSTICKPYTHTKGVSCRPHPCMKETQTDDSLNRKYLIPVPTPIFVPTPMHMFATPFPVPVPFPLPVPVPIFIPTTRNSAKGIFKEIKKIQEKIPTDPFEAELLMMAEMVAGDKKQDATDSESDEGGEAEEGPDTTFSPEVVDTSNTFGDDMLQMALKMASELEEPAVDMESVLTPNTITPSSQPQVVDPNKTLYTSDPDDPDPVPMLAMNRGRKRTIRTSRGSPTVQSKRGRRSSSSTDVPMLPPPEPVQPQRIEVEKPDANMCLKYTFGVNAWRHWVMQKNNELEKAAVNNRKIKPFKPELLQLTADELNFSLCLFVKEVKKPNGTEYAPDTIYYLCLGIQQYLFENGRIDNIFTDVYYEKFTDCLDDVAKKFAVLYNDAQYIVTRVEEEHLWESKQLGAHSPHVLLSTLMFFNTKHFNLTTVEEHMQLSFSHIMKHWKRNPNAPGVAKIPGSRNVLLRFYPPQSALEANSRKKKVYEQQENEDNPLRCPVKLYEFYLSKCPESVKTRNDVFYLLPERSCVPDSPVWYSTMALGKEPLMKMLHRVKMVKEINIALLTS